MRRTSDEGILSMVVPQRMVARIDRIPAAKTRGCSPQDKAPHSHIIQNFTDRRGLLSRPQRARFLSNRAAGMWKLTSKRNTLSGFTYSWHGHRSYEHRSGQEGSTSRRSTTGHRTFFQRFWTISWYACWDVCIPSMLPISTLAEVPAGSQCCDQWLLGSQPAQSRKARSYHSRRRPARHSESTWVSVPKSDYPPPTPAPNRSRTWSDKCSQLMTRWLVRMKAACSRDARSQALD